jgi:AraC family transcriptional regulator
MSLRQSRLFGDVLKTYVGSELRLTETLCAPSFRAPRHSHELFQFCFIIEGGFSENCGQKTRECAPLTLITHPPDETHANRYYSSGAHCFVVEIEHRWLSRSREYSLALDRSAEFNYGSAVWLAKRLYDEFYRMDRASPLAIEGLTLEMMAEVSRRHVKTSEGTSPRWLEQARDLLHAHFSEELTLEGIAGAVGTHPVHLARVFRQYHGCTVGEYVRRLRVEFACRELSLTNTPLLQVALAAGFYDQSHFSRTFKKIVGLTPTAYRTSFRPR